MSTAEDYQQASEARAAQHLHWADRAYGLAQDCRDQTADRNRDVSRAMAAASRAFWAAGDAHYAAADAHDIAAICNSAGEPQPDEYEYANEASHAAREAFQAAIRAARCAREYDAFGMANEIGAAENAEQAARLVREAEDAAERCLNGR